MARAPRDAAIGGLRLRSPPARAGIGETGRAGGLGSGSRRLEPPGGAPGRRMRMNRLFGVVIGCNYEGTPRPDLPALQGAERDAKRMAGLLVAQPIEDGTLGGMALLLGAAVTISLITESIGRM